MPNDPVEEKLTEFWDKLTPREQALFTILERSIIHRLSGLVPDIQASNTQTMLDLIEKAKGTLDRFPG